jgi:amidase
MLVDWRKEGNALTGPFFVEGAEPGDAVLLHLRKVRMNRNWGQSTYRLGLFSLTPDAVENIYSGKTKPDLVIKGTSILVPWDLDLTRQTVRLREPRSQRVKFEFAVQPMLGCIGVAPAGDFAPTSGPAGHWGGNLDYQEVRESATVLLPVYHPGGLLFLGDGHALQADGEPLGCGIETSMDVEFSVDLRKNAKLTGPRLDTDEYIISIGAQAEFESSVDRALQIATTDMIQWLTDEYKLEPWAAHVLVGMQGKYDVITVAGSAALRIHKRYLPSK